MDARKVVGHLDSVTDGPEPEPLRESSGGKVSASHGNDRLPVALDKAVLMLPSARSAMDDSAAEVKVPSGNAAEEAIIAISHKVTRGPTGLGDEFHQGLGNMEAREGF